MPPRYRIEGVNYRPREERDRYLATGDWIDCTIGEMLRRAARKTPDKTAVVGHDSDLTFREVDEASEKFAAGLLTTGMKPGDRMMFQVGTVTEFFSVFYGCFKAGVIPVCTLPQFREIEMEALARRSGATAYIVQADVNPSFDQLAFARRMRERLPQITSLYVVRGKAGSGEHSLSAIVERFTATEARVITRPHDPDPEDVAALQLSGGSTGLPKLIPRFHAEYLGSTNSLCRRYELGPDDKTLWTLPLIHNAGGIFAVLPMALDSRTTS